MIALASVINFTKFWEYYNATAKTVNNSKYSKQLFSSFSKALEDLQLKDFRYPGNWPTPETISKNMTKICGKVRVNMISNGVPAAAVTNILDRFKKWYREFY